ncbi:MAG: hypothetical protein H6Q05_2912 [Acidobacteria bacterium]|nr:hypothetical protein [Acidobacteriota bacterium]
MRSRKVSPAFDVMRTLIMSDSTRVPPVTAERSPPDSRMTGADSPVIADSSTEAMPSMTSPSPGMNSPALTITTSPVLSLEPGTVSVPPPGNSRLAMVSERVLRSESACALPRPSAMASAKFANKTVNHNHSVICRLKPNWVPPLNRRMVVITAPTCTTNMTGFAKRWRGFSFTNESRIARRTIFHSQMALGFGFRWDGSISCAACQTGMSVGFAVIRSSTHGSSPIEAACCPPLLNSGAVPALDGPGLTGVAGYYGEHRPSPDCLVSCTEHP